jgi:hypothetical protein
VLLLGLPNSIVGVVSSNGYPVQIRMDPSNYQSGRIGPSLGFRGYFANTAGTIGILKSSECGMIVSTTF